MDSPQLVDQQTNVTVHALYIYDKRSDPWFMAHCEAILVRVQLRNLEQRLNQFRALGKGSNANATIVYRKPKPNAINIVNRLKETGGYAVYRSMGVDRSTDLERLVVDFDRLSI